MKTWQKARAMRSANEKPDETPERDAPLCADCGHTDADHLFGKCDALDKDRVRCKCPAMVRANAEVTHA